MSHAVVIDAVRTPRGAAKDSGALHAVAPMELLAGALRAIKDRNHLDTDQIVDGVFGCVTQTGEQGGNVGKTACLLAGLSPYMSAVTINRFCASGLSAVNWAAQQARDIISTPPPKLKPSLSRACCAAQLTALRPEAQKRLMVTALI